ncbi:MAG: hypothetical protein JNJ48_02630 [Phycisphaerae bacterium]|nr:hypothetical protein [Phycisphaerae bacterium]
MKWFWLAIAAIVAAAAAALFWLPSRGPGKESPRSSRVEPAPARPEPRPAPVTPTVEPAVAPQVEQKPPAGPAAAPPPIVKFEGADAAKPADTMPSAPAAPAPEAPAKPVEIAPAAARPVEPSPPPAVTQPAPAVPAASTPASPGVREYAIPAHPVFNGDKIMPAKAEKRSDGVLMLDGRFAIKGSGTEEDPFVLPWDLLVSAQETYKPRMGQMRLPQRVTMFDGAHVVITGYVAFPLTATDPKEMLMMLNQWDGCCIGVPPTPYDAIEVRLAKKPPDSARLATHGTMRGRFKVEPYEDGGWLLGLYMLEDATLKVDQ